MIQTLSTYEVLDILRDGRYQGPINDQKTTHLQYVNPQTGTIAIRSAPFKAGQLVTPRLRDIVTDFAEAVMQYQMTH